MRCLLHPAAGCASALVALIVFSTGIASPQPASPRPPAPSVAFSGFTIHITYSAKALQTLQSGHETVIAAAFILGYPKPHAPKRLVDEMGQIDFPTLNREVAPGTDAVFAPFKLDKTTLSYLDSRGPQLRVNVYSGRKSSQFNLLACSLYEGPLAAAANQTLPISCKLIGEN
jgi:hypothetical protein